MKQLIAVIVLGIVGGSIFDFKTEETPHIIEYAQAEEVAEVVLIETKIEWTEERIKEEIRNTFPEEPERMIKVAQCESGLRNVPGQLSDDGGIFQINIVHKNELAKQGLDRFVIEDNIKFARYLYDNGGLAHWKASKYCWGG